MHCIQEFVRVGIHDNKPKRLDQEKSKQNDTGSLKGEIKRWVARFWNGSMFILDYRCERRSITELSSSFVCTFIVANLICFFYCGDLREHAIYRMVVYGCLLFRLFLASNGRGRSVLGVSSMNRLVRGTGLNGVGSSNADGGVRRTFSLKAGVYT